MNEPRNYLNFRLAARLSNVVMILSLAGMIFGCVSTLPEPGKDVDTEKMALSHVQLGLGYIQNGNRDLARQHFNKAMEYDSRSPAANDGIAMLYQMDGEPELAEKHFKRAIQLDRNYSRARNNYGTFLLQHGRAVEAYDQFEEASKDVKYNRRDNTLYNLGLAALQLGREEKALAAFDHSINLNPKQYGAMIELAELYFKDRDYPQAKKYLDLFTADSRHTSRTLWLAIRLERIFGNKDNEASYALQLKNLHPYSQEYLEYKNSLENQ